LHFSAKAVHFRFLLRCAVIRGKVGVKVVSQFMKVTTMGLGDLFG
jgi:hypothetical protein